jgi:hypothetical protein
MTDVFLSYSSADRPVAERVQAQLAARGLDVFWDQTIPAGQDWDTWIRARLTEARTVVVLWSRTSVQSPNVRHEAMVARDAGKLLPAMIDALKPEDFPMGLYLVQAVMIGDARDPQSPAMQKLSDEIHRQIERAPQPMTRVRPTRKGQRLPLVAAAVALVLAGVAGFVAWTSLPRPGADMPAPVATDGAAATNSPAAVATPSAAAPPVDPCVRAREDWASLDAGANIPLVEAYLASVPESCPLQRAVAEQSLARFRAADASRRADRQRAWNGVPGFDGDWILDSGGCLELPWRFAPEDLRLRRTLSSGATDMWEVRSTEPQVIAMSDGSRMTLEGNRIRYLDPDGNLNCLLKRR